MLDDVLNMATLDFLGMGGSPEVKEAADAALDRYGCGSCGPRGFYGTVDVHLRLEERMAEFWGTEGAILYSDGASTVSSTIAAFCKRGDLLVVDDAVSEPLVTGVALSRAHVKWFAHNDMADLRRVLGQVSAKDAQLGRPANAQRRFLVAEGLYRNTGTICPLDELVRLKEEFAFRLILDESLAAGVLGPTGRGVTELYGLKPMRHVEITTIGLEAALGSIGGVTVGTEEVVEHQRLSGSGYCFSASAPPFTAVAAMTSLQMLKDNPDDYLQRIGDNVVYMYEKLKAWCEERRGLLAVRSDERSPVVVLQVADCPETECLDEGVFFGEVARECLDRGVAVCVGGRGQQTASPKSSRPAPTPPSLRMALTATHSHADIDRALSVLAEAVDEVMDQFLEEAKQA
jgi:serine palmitoyltransferase